MIVNAIPPSSLNGSLRRYVMQRKLWVIVLAIWFLMFAIFALLATKVSTDIQQVVMGIGAALVAILAFLDR